MAVVALCLALGLGHTITAPATPHRQNCLVDCAGKAVALVAPRESAPTPPMQGPGVAAPVPLAPATPQLEDSQRWANARPWPPAGWQQPQQPRRDWAREREREEVRTVGGFFRSLDRSLSTMFR